MHKIKKLGQLGIPAIALAIGSLSTPAIAADNVKTFSDGVYIVQLADPPVATLSPGNKVNPDSPAVQAHVARLQAAQNAAAASADIGSKIYSYTHTVNGFAASMTAKQAMKLAKMPGVISVTKDEKYQLDTATTPDFLGLSGPGGFYATSGFKGENVIVGIVDSGIWPDHPSLSPAGFGPPPAKWTGSCQTGPGFTAASCNNKLIGARFYNAGFGGNAGVMSLFPYEYNSPKDADGHGTHTTTTAGGNEGVSTAGSSAAAFGSVNGIAPRARVAMYKVCWGRGGPPAGCWGVDSVAAIEQAVKDGVDVINFSISGTASNFIDPVETAFRNAATAGVFVAASAGNSGPALQTVAHPSPWITTVAASTHNRSATGTLTTGAPTTVFSGASSAVMAVPAGTPMIASSAAGLAGADATKVAQCHAAIDNGGVAVLDPAKVGGKIVVCDRGATARVNKSRAVKEAGGVGMVLVNVVTDSLNSDLHSVPTVHLQAGDRAAVLAYAGTATPTGAISSAMIALTAPAPFTASFSSRGPSFATGQFDLLKPDIIAPGQDILAGVSPDGYNGALFGMLSGTSMSSPHIAGVAALLKQARPGWSPMAIKSAIMTTAGDVLDGPNTLPEVIWRQGAGHVNPSKALNPGLVYDSGPIDWTGFLCGQGMLIAPACPVFTMDASDLNMASIGVGFIPGSQTVKRRVTNVSGNPQTFTASVTGMAGYTVVVTPSVLTLGAGVTREFTVTFTRTTAPVFAGNVSDFRGGQLTWSNGITAVRIPIVVTASALTAIAPAAIAGSGGLMTYKVNVGYTGPFSLSTRGLVPSIENTGALATGVTAIIPVTVPAGTTHARFSMFDSDVPAGSDFDIVVKAPGGATVGGSFGFTSQEEVNLVSPAPGVYTVEVTAFAVSGTAPFKLHSFILGSTSNGNMVAYSNPMFNVQAGQQVTVSVIPLPWGLTFGKRYMGSVVYNGNAGLPVPTIVRIDR